jgi:PAS domain-containing protein
MLKTPALATAAIMLSVAPALFSMTTSAHAQRPPDHPRVFGVGCGGFGSSVVHWIEESATNFSAIGHRFQSADNAKSSVQNEVKQKWDAAWVEDLTRRGPPVVLAPDLAVPRPGFGSSNSGNLIDDQTIRSCFPKLAKLMADTETRVAAERRAEAERAAAREAAEAERRRQHAAEAELENQKKAAELLQQAERDRQAAEAARQSAERLRQATEAARTAAEQRIQQERQAAAAQAGVPPSREEATEKAVAEQKEKDFQNAQRDWLAAEATRKAAAEARTKKILSEPNTKLQLQFQRWGYENSSTTRVLAALRNPTAMDFAHLVWNCNFYDKEKFLIGRSPIIFDTVAFGSVTVKSNLVFVNGGMFESATCSLVKAEERTRENERLYRVSIFDQHAIGIFDPKSDEWFRPNLPTEGQAEVISKEDEDKLYQMRVASPGKLILRSDIAASEKQSEAH